MAKTIITVEEEEEEEINSFNDNANNRSIVILKPTDVCYNRATRSA